MPAMPASSAGQDVEGEEDLPRPHAGEARCHRVVADGVQQASEAGPAQPVDDGRGDGDEDEQAVGDEPRVVPVASQVTSAGTWVPTLMTDRW